MCTANYSKELLRKRQGLATSNIEALQSNIEAYQTGCARPSAAGLCATLLLSLEREIDLRQLLRSKTLGTNGAGEVELSKDSGKAARRRRRPGEEVVVQGFAPRSEGAADKAGELAAGGGRDGGGARRQGHNGAGNPRLWPKCGGTYVKKQAHRAN